MSAESNAVIWAFLSAGLALVAIVVALGAALVIYQRRFLRMHREYADGLVSAHEEERAWVAREVHDDALQRIMIVLQELDGCAERARGTNGLRRQLVALRAELEDLSAVLRQLAYRLHPVFVEQEGVGPSLKRLAGDLARTAPVHIEVVDESPGAPGLTPDKALVVYRIAQEALANLVRHARSETARVQVRTENGTLELTVEDQGRGFDVEAARRAGGLGLTSMTERARAAGGTLTIQSQAGAGTSVYLRLPLARSGES